VAAAAVWPQHRGGRSTAVAAAIAVAWWYTSAVRKPQHRCGRSAETTSFVTLFKQEAQLGQPLGFGLAFGSSSFVLCPLSNLLVASSKTGAFLHAHRCATKSFLRWEWNGRSLNGPFFIGCYHVGYL
jgi:hypothetical protein